MNLTRLRYFVTVAEELHFGRAAERLHMAQPPLSQQIRLLEKEIGSDLFERTTRRVELTTAGRLLASEARELLRNADALDRLMHDYQAGDTGVLRLGFVDSASYEVMPRFLRAFRERWPGVRFELLTMSSDTQRAALASGDLDLGIARTSGDEPGIAQTIILEERLYVAVSSHHRLASRRSTTLSQLAGESFIGFTRTQSPALSAELSAVLANNGVDYLPVIEAAEYTTIVGLVAAGEGIAVVPSSVRSFQPADLKYVELRDTDAKTRLMMLSRSREQLRVVQHALDVAIDLFG